MPQPKEGESLLGPYRALDLSDDKGFLCGRILADLGADVIKIERPGGDTARRIGPFYHDIPDPEKSLYWFAYNVGKRGITLNIETADGQDIFQRLVKTADFVIESFTPGHMDELGLGYKALSALNPRLIMASITSFGQTGPKAKDKACDLTSWASGGALYCAGDPDRPPVQLSFPQAYLHAAARAALGSLIALYHREQAGEGQQVDVSIQESVMAVLMDAPEMWDLNRFVFRRKGYGLVHPSRGIRQRFGVPCKDGYASIYMMGGAPGVILEHMKAMVRWMDEEGMAPDWLKDLDWVSDYDSAKVSQETIDRVEEAFINFLMTKTKANLSDAVIPKRLVMAPILDAKDLAIHPQLAERDYWVKVEHPELGEAITYCGPFAKLGQAPIEIQRPPPLIGEHNMEVYEQELGFSRSQLSALKSAGVI